MWKKPMQRAIMVCGFAAAQAINLFALNISSITLMAAAVAGLSVSAAKGR